MTLYEQYRARGLEVLLIGFREPRELVQRVVKERGYTALVLFDHTGDVSSVAYGVFGPPTMVLVDRQGRLLARAVGPRDWASPAARKLIEELLAAP
jgi:hypothetical protein